RARCPCRSRAVPAGRCQTQPCPFEPLLRSCPPHAACASSAPPTLDVGLESRDVRLGAWAGGRVTAGPFRLVAPKNRVARDSVTMATPPGLPSERLGLRSRRPHGRRPTTHSCQRAVGGAASAATVRAQTA